MECKSLNVVLLVAALWTITAAARVVNAAPDAASSTGPATKPTTTSSAERRHAWHVRNIVEAYERVGSRNPKWDESARLAIATASQTWGGRRVINADQKTMAAAQAAVDTGCDDAMVRFIHARMHVGLNPRSADNQRLHEAAADALAASGYTPYYKALSSLRAAEFMLKSKKADLKAAAQRRLDAAAALLPEVGRDTSLPTSMWYPITQAMTASYMRLGETRQVAYEKLDAALRGAAPETVALAEKGRFYTAHAWEARGGGYADTVTDKGWKDMGERLAVAQQALERAWKLDPTNSEAAELMVGVELGQGQGKQRMELWFKRAVQANPNNYQAYTAKMYYLEPRWYGTPAEMLAFGRECVRGEKWEAGIPFVLVDAHSRLSHYTGGGYQSKTDWSYIARPAVWKEIASVYDQFLERYPDSIDARARYGIIAYRAKQWDVAHEQFELIADYYEPAAFEPEGFEAMRKEAAEHAAKKSNGPADGRL